MNQAEALYTLQQIELQMLRTQKRLDEIAVLLADRQTVAAAQQAAETAAKALSPLRAKVRDLELEIQSTGQKAKSAEQQLYSGSVKNPKAMQEMQQEITALKKRQGELEDKLLETMMLSEEAQAKSDDAETHLNQTRQTWESAHTDLLAEQADLNAKLENFKAQRQTAAKAVTPDNLKQYNALKPRKANQPMALLNGNSCSLCGIEQTMNIVQQARRGENLIPCLNCGRFLVYKP
jgi:uncharacterized protein